ncbi:hypothetical protein C8A05DRAFT_36423 [Staphylotrichum tortipilum]|uniref:Uncharacterized protein n=1 Tax=Staphylotrichum tortipilum TaxID=2831512 RepID=A0AAN6RRY2_9PEZI|nr:hypothetical protein C8A05DRAFT_36423 [Staphylotrichum longicolle]
MFPSSPTTIVLFTLLGLLPHLIAVSTLSSADEWSDFSNNFATDLVPLITLFGEQVTKQFLSESVGFLDNLIFALAPLGICRVFGRPKIFEFMYTEENAPHLWSFVLGTAGTFFLILGMGLCARLVEQRSVERLFTIIDKSDGVRPQIFWLQCGDQRVGDQQFRSFAYSEEKREYTTSYLRDEVRYALHRFTLSTVLWLAIVLSLLGFACQFVGFRSLHGSIALYQLACTLTMSAIRALLRSRRLGRQKNCLEAFFRYFDSDELEWQAMAIIRHEEFGEHETSPGWLSSWRLVNSHLDTGLRNSPLSMKAQTLLASSRVQVLVSEAAIGSGLLGFRVPVGKDSSGSYTEEQKDALCARAAVKFIQVLGGELPQGEGLAAEEATLMSIVPALFHHSKLPSLDESVDQLLSDANSLRANRQYEQGEAQLKGLFNICSLQHHEKVVRALGELYRHASKSPTESHRDFGIRSMKAIREKLTSRHKALKLSEAGSEALNDYEQLAEFLSSSTRRSAYPPGRRNRLQLPMSAVLELHDGLRPPEEGRGRSRLKTLMVLEMYNMAERNSPVLQGLLFTAIALRHPEVLEDLRALNPDLLLESRRTRFSPSPLFGSGGIPHSGSTVGFLALTRAASQLQSTERVPGEAEGMLRMMLDWASLANDFTDANKNTVLMHAVGSGNVAAVDILLEWGADFRVANSSGETALSRAVGTGHYSIAERILKEGHEKASLPPAYLHSALSVAFFAYKQLFIELLLRNGAGIDDLNERGESLLFRALTPFKPYGRDLFPSQDRDRGLVPLLLENGAAAGDLLPDILEIAINHRGALAATLKAAIAARRGAHALDGRELPFNPLIRLLLEIGVPVSPGDLRRAIRARIPDDVLATLVEKGQPAFSDAALEDYGTPLQILLNDGGFWNGPAAARERVLGLLIKAGCDVNLGSAYWQATPLQTICARVRSSSQADSERADVNLTVAAEVSDGRGLINSTPLELACVTGKAGLVRALLDAGAEENTPGGEIGPPLQAACLQFGQRQDRDNVEIISMLIKAGADINAVGEPGGTAIAVAAHFLLPGAVKTLLDAGADPALPVGDKAQGAYNDVWDALEVRTNRNLVALFVAFFNTMGDLLWMTGVDRDSEAANKTRDQIRELLASHSSTTAGPRQPNGD